MNTVIGVAIGLLVIIAAVFMMLWIVDARRADQVAGDAERVSTDAPRRRRRWAPRHSR